MWVTGFLAILFLQRSTVDSEFPILQFTSYQCYDILIFLLPTFPTFKFQIPCHSGLKTTCLYPEIRQDKFRRFGLYLAVCSLDDIWGWERALRSLNPQGLVFPFCTSFGSWSCPVIRERRIVRASSLPIPGESENQPLVLDNFIRDKYVPFSPVKFK